MNKKYLTITGSIAMAVAIVTGAALPAFAQTGLGVGVAASATVSASGGGQAHGGTGVSSTIHLATMTNRATQEIARRVAALNALNARLTAMIRLSAVDKNNLSIAIKSQLTALNTLQAKINTDAMTNNVGNLKADVRSILTSYRIFVLILPQGMIEAAAGRAFTIVGIMNDLSAKFAARISAAQAAGNNVTVASAALADFNAKVSSGNIQARAAVAEVSSLTPDNSNQSVMASNTVTLKDARSKIQAAQQDFVAARADAETIIAALAMFKVSAAATSTVSASTSAQ